MGSMPAMIAKPTLLTKIQEYVNSDPGTVAPRMKQKLEQSSLIDAINNATNLTFTNQEKKHLVEDWFGSWWRMYQPIAPIVRNGVIKALELVIQEQVPLDCYWVCAEDVMEVYVTKSGQQITLMLFTPPPPDAEMELTRLEDIWRIRGGVRKGEQLEGVDQTSQVLTLQVRG